MAFEVASLMLALGEGKLDIFAFDHDARRCRRGVLMFNFGDEQRD